MKHPYPYQERVLEAMMAGENVILVIPTGGGKTFAACLPFWQSRIFEDGLLPAKAHYVTPMRVLATQFLDTCREFEEKDFNPDLIAPLKTMYQRFDRDLFSIQTGEMPQDPQFEAMMTACTIDQLLASALGVPYSIDAKFANINVGAICSSYLILDEPHLYPLSHDGRSYKGAFTTCLELLRLLKGLTRFVFMSATMSRPLVQRLSALLDARIITVDEKELAELNKGRVRRFERSPIPMSAEGILELHKRCSLVVCNTVQRAQETYLQLSEQIERRGLEIELKLLHSRFTDEDRRRQEDDLRQKLGQDQWKAGVYQGQNIIVVATQVVEVGLDISVETLHTEIAPANSLVQRAGRCARFEQQQGQVIVYPLRLNEQGQPVSSLPYSAAICAETWRELEQFEGREMGFHEELQLVDLVHTAGDLELLERYENHCHELQDAITLSLQTNERSNRPELIRDVTQVQILVHNKPEEEITTEPWRWQSFSIHPGQLLGKHWDHLRARQAELNLDWACKQAVISSIERQEEREGQNQDEDNRQPTLYDWTIITNPAEIPKTLMIALPNELATYDSQLGLVFLDGRLTLPESWQRRLEGQGYQSALCGRRRSLSSGKATSMQSYEQHISGLADAYHYAIRHELAYTMQRLETLMDLEPGTLDQAIQLAIATHDLGKLDERWQQWARAWQRLYTEKTGWAAYYEEPKDDYFFAKTNYDYRSREQRQWKKELKCSRPPHACESVRISRRMLIDALKITSANSPNQPVLRAIGYAIAHHHTTDAHTYGATRVSPSALASIEKALLVVRRDGSDSWSYDLQKLNLSFEAGDLFPANASSGQFSRPDVASGPQERLETWLAFVIVRALRLADQRADRYASL
jgi:CRISPR-associated endonuclease/helicase Cas3